MPTPDVDALVEGARRGERRAIARLLTLVEQVDGAGPDARRAADLLAPHAGSARVVGLTGPPGVGKSTSTSALVGVLRARGDTVAVLAVDPSSPFSGGALLGDRIRMGEHASDDGVYIRSLASRGRLGGLAAAVPQALRVLDAAGFDVVLVETVGVGQAEVEIASLADTTIVLLAPGLGDGVQAAKAGILEVADVYVVNKADRDGADVVARELRQVLAMARDHDPEVWRAPIVKTVASQGRGVDDVLAALDAHAAWLRRGDGSGLAARRAARAEVEVEALVQDVVHARLLAARGPDGLSRAAVAVAAGELSPFTAADRLLDGL
ncbi:methylmalonyl Co-A mutase-associated GTPase MeaB [Jatrophihabitans sp. YIM 134969]